MDALTLKSFFTGFFRRRSLRPRGLFAHVNATASAPASSGSVEGALQSAAVWACLRLISQSIAVCPGHVFEETLLGKVKAFEHPLYRVLSKQPNALMTFTQFIQTTVLNLLMWGNAFWIPEMVEGEVVALYVVDPSLVEIIFDAKGNFTYQVSRVGRKPEIFAPLGLIHFRIFSLDGIIGLSPLDYHRATVESEMFAQAYAASLFANGGRPSGVLEYPGALKKDQIDSIRTSWQMLHAGPGSAGRIAVLEGGTKYHPISVPLDQLQYVNQQKMTVEQIARIYGVPPHMIGGQDQTPFASVEQQSLEFSMYTQQPIIVSIEQSIETSLLRPPFFFKLNLNSFQRADINSRYRAYAMGRQWGWFSVNDIRALEDLNMIGPEGDVYLQPLNMAPAEVANNPTAEADTALAAAMKGQR